MTQYDDGILFLLYDRRRKERGEGEGEVYMGQTGVECDECKCNGGRKIGGESWDGYIAVELWGEYQPDWFFLDVMTVSF